MTKNEVDVNEVVKEEYITPSSIYDGQYTKTTQFMLYAIGINKNSRLINNYFINSYLDDRGIEHRYERPIFVLFGVKSFKDREWRKVYETLVKTVNYVDDYDCGKQDDRNLVMMVFKVPDEFERDYYYFKRGKYSQFSQAYKDKFPKQLPGDDGKMKDSVIWQVITKAPELKRELEIEFDLEEGQLDWPDTKEIWDLPRKEREYYRYAQNISG
jgi:hypothetical protein